MRRAARRAASTAAGDALPERAEQVHEQLGAARAHQAADAEHLAGAHVEGDVAQDALAVAGRATDEALDREQRLARRASRGAETDP